MSELRECPFCLSLQGQRIASYSRRKTYVLCVRCRAQGPIQNASDPVRADAEKAWNTRPADAVREAAKKAVREWRSWTNTPADFEEAMHALRAALAQDGRGR